MDEVKTKKGETRIFLKEGKFVIYGYKLDGKLKEKVKLVLKNGKREEYFIIPLKNGKKLMIPSEAHPKKVLKNGKVIEV